MERAEWKNLQDTKVDFPATDYVGNQHYVFNISKEQMPVSRSDQIYDKVCFHSFLGNLCGIRQTRIVQRYNRITTMTRQITKLQHELADVGRCYRLRKRARPDRDTLHRGVDRLLIGGQRHIGKRVGRVNRNQSFPNQRFCDGTGGTTLKITRALCLALIISLAEMLGIK